MKKLIPAFALLLISAVVMSTASFAWFSMNTTVTASDMKVKATASKNLLISNQQNNGYGSSIQFNIEHADNLTACSTVKAPEPVFYKIQNVSGMTPENFGHGTSTFTIATEGTDYVKTKLYIKSTGEDASNLKCSITIAGGGNADLDPAIRVMVVTTQGQYFYTPKVGASAWKGVASLNGGNPTFSVDNEVVSTSATSILDSLTADNAYPIDIYVWYEGQDANCTANKAVNLDETNLTLTFSVS